MERIFSSELERSLQMEVLILPAFDKVACNKLVVSDIVRYEQSFGSKQFGSI
jgi:hypothetical protein